MKSLTDMAGDLNTSTAQILTALRIVATRAGVRELAGWAAKEMDGYQDNDELPAHRIWNLTIIGNLHNPMQGFIQNVHLGDYVIAEKVRERATTFRCQDSVGDIERMLTNSTTGSFSSEFPNLVHLVNSGPMASDGWTCTHAFAQFSSAHLQEVVTKARQTALRLCLECEENGIELRWTGAEGTSEAERARWLDALKDEGTRVILRAAWDSIRVAVIG